MRSSYRNERGASAVEFALLAPLIFMLIFGMVEFGLAFLTTQSLRAGVREGARQAAVGASASQVQSAVLTGAAGGLDGSSQVVTVTGPNGAVSGGGLACSGTNTLGKNVTVSIDTSNYAAIPPNVVESLSVRIPFVTTVTLHPTISGTFRCEQ